MCLNHSTNVPKLCRKKFDDCHNEFTDPCTVEVSSINGALPCQTMAKCPIKRSSLFDLTYHRELHSKLCSCIYNTERLPLA